MTQAGRKELMYGNILLDNLLAGAKVLADLVGGTLGPFGHNVIYLDRNGKLYTTNDGRRIVENFHSMNLPEIEFGAEMIKEASIKTENEAGDGSTSSILFSYELLKHGIIELKKGTSPLRIKEGMNLAKQYITQYLKKISQQCTLLEVEKIATICSNNDPVLGKMFQEIYNEIGCNGNITFSKTFSIHEKSISHTIKKGYNISKGFIDHCFINHEGTKTWKADKGCYVLIAALGLRLQDIGELLEKCLTEKRGLLIISDEVENLLINVYKGSKIGKPDICIIPCPSYAEHKNDYLNDISYFIDGQIYGGRGDMLLGGCESIEVTNKSTLLIGGRGSQIEIDNRINKIKTEILPTSLEQIVLVKKDRISNLNGKFAHIIVSAKSDIETNELYDRIEDVVKGVKSCLEEGIIPGGEFFRMSDKMKIKHLNEDIQKGIDIVIKSLNFQMKKILENAEMDFEEFKHHRNSNTMVFNIKTGLWENKTNTQVIDSCKVLRNIIENSISLVSSILLSNAMIY